MSPVEGAPEASIAVLREVRAIRITLWTCGWAGRGRGQYNRQDRTVALASVRREHLARFGCEAGSL